VRGESDIRVTGINLNNKVFHLILGLWLLQLIWLAWHFAPEAWDIGCRLATCRTGEAVHREEAYYRWLKEIEALLPPTSTYIFVDCYEAGKDIEAGYILYPRKIVTMNPLATPAALFEEIKREGVEYLVLRECNLYPHWQFLFQPHNPVFHPLPVSGPGLVFKVDLQKLTGGFYD
jgi:hypothetical protein